MDINKHCKRVVELKNLVLKSKNGAPRLNFYRDLGMNEENQTELYKYRLKKIAEDMDNKNDLCRKIYEFEKQMFILQGKIDGLLPESAELAEAVLQKDVKATKLNYLVDLETDPNARLRRYRKY